MTRCCLRMTPIRLIRNISRNISYLREHTPNHNASTGCRGNDHSSHANNRTCARRREGADNRQDCQRSLQGPKISPVPQLRAASQLTLRTQMTYWLCSYFSSHCCARLVATPVEPRVKLRTTRRKAQGTVSVTASTCMRPRLIVFEPLSAKT